MRHVDLYISFLFGVVVPAFLFMPWISIIEDFPLALNGMALAFGKYNIQPTEYYGLAMLVIAAVGAIGPPLSSKAQDTNTCGVGSCRNGIDAPYADSSS